MLKAKLHTGQELLVFPKSSWHPPQLSKKVQKKKPGISFSSDGLTLSFLAPALYSRKVWNYRKER